MLPPIPLSIPVNPETAIQQRHPEEESRYYTLQPPLSEPLLPDDTETDIDAAQNTGDETTATASTSVLHGNQSLSLLLMVKRLTHYPRSQTELAGTVILGVLSMILFVYGMVFLYKCMCPRNYAKWRSNWGKGHGKRKKSPYYKQIRESMPLVLEGHLQVRSRKCLGG